MNIINILMILNTMTSFIIVNYNTWELTCKCVATILEYIPEGSYEIIVVDNGSKDDDKLSLKKNLSENCRLVESRLNVGFGAGNMLGANLAKGRFLCFINSDVELVEDCITPLCQFLDGQSLGGVFVDVFGDGLDSCAVADARCKM